MGTRKGTSERSSGPLFVTGDAEQALPHSLHKEVTLCSSAWGACFIQLASIYCLNKFWCWLRAESSQAKLKQCRLCGQFSPDLEGCDSLREADPVQMQKKRNKSPGHPLKAALMLTGKAPPQGSPCSVYWFMFNNQLFKGREKKNPYLSFIVQSLSSVVTPWTAARQLPCPSLSPGVCSNSRPLSQ